MNEINTNNRGRKSEISKLKEQVNQMEKRQDEFMSKFETFMSIISGNMNLQNSVSSNDEIKKVQKEVDTEKTKENFEQPKSDELIKICSLTHGELNLGLDGRIAISFRKYGDIKPVLYSKLVNIVNENRSFAEYGDFYIMDERAVYHLGLSEYYKKIYPIEVLNNIENYDREKIEEILSNMCKPQRETVVINIAQKMYDNEEINQNSVKIIENILNIDIHEMVKTMREIDENLKK